MKKSFHRVKDFALVLRNEKHMLVSNGDIMTIAILIYLFSRKDKSSKKSTTKPSQSLHRWFRKRSSKAA